MSVRKLQITLPEAALEAIESRVEAGLYETTDDAMHAAVEALLREEDEHELRLDVIRQRVRQSLDDPRPSLSSTEMRAHLAALYARHRS